MLSTCMQSKPTERVKSILLPKRPSDPEAPQWQNYLASEQHTSVHPRTLQRPVKQRPAAHLKGRKHLSIWDAWKRQCTSRKLTNRMYRQCFQKFQF